MFNVLCDAVVGNDPIITDPLNTAADLYTYMGMAFLVGLPILLSVVLLIVIIGGKKKYEKNNITDDTPGK